MISHYLRKQRFWAELSSIKIDFGGYNFKSIYKVQIIQKSTTNKIKIVFKENKCFNCINVEKNEFNIYGPQKKINFLLLEFIYEKVKAN